MFRDGKRENWSSTFLTQRFSNYGKKLIVKEQILEPN
jgi:hypothetical protein